MNALLGARPLTLVQVRTSARSIAAWVLLISALSVSSVVAYPVVFPDPGDRAELAATLAANPALSLIFGPARDLTTADGFNAWRAGTLGAFFAGLMTTLLVVRHTRAHEDSGQAELLASGVLARQSRLASGVLVAAVASLALGVTSFSLTVAAGGGRTSTLVLAATFTASGLVFAGVAAVSAQVAADARTATSLAVGSLGVVFAIRGYVDVADAPGWASWLTPFGWLQQTRPAAGNNPWPLVPALGLALALVGLSAWLHGRRDYGQGAIPPRPGPARGHSVAGVWRLSVRLNRSSVAVWTAALTCVGVVFGSLATSVGELITDNPAMAKVMAAGAVDEADLTFGFLVTLTQLITLLAAVFGIQSVMRVHVEESAHRLEPLLAGSVRRTEYLASTAFLAFGAPAVALVVAGTSAGLVAAAGEADLAALDVTRQAVATVPALWTLIGIAFVAAAARPALRMLGWLGVVLSFGLTILGPTLDLPDRALDLSPLRHIPNVTGAAVSWDGPLWLLGLSLALVGVAFVGFRHRDVT